MIVSMGTRRVSILEDEPTASFSVERVLRETIAGEPRQNGFLSVRATVEILRHGGGMMPRALLGGVLTASERGELLIEVQTSGPGAQGSRTCTSQLSKPLIPGLPDEFAKTAMDGLVRRARPSGRIVVDRAAFDPVESSPLAFELAAELLSIVLDASSMERDVELAVRDAVEAWP